MAITRRQVLKACVAAGVGAVTGGSTYGFVYGRHALELTEASLPVAGLPPALDGLRIGLLTDVHRSRWVPDEDVRRAVGLLLATKPDLIVLGGDYVTWGDRTYVGPSAEALTGLNAPNGVFGILGNHDDDRDMPAALARKGVQILKDARTTVIVRGEPVDLIGIRYWTRKASEIAAIAHGSSGIVFLLAHDPRRFAEAQVLKIPVVLSGHTHGGQVVLPLIGAVAAQINMLRLRLLSFP